MLAMAGPGEKGVAVLFCDLNRFKVINDSLGHDAGDRVLTTVARRLGGSVRRHDIVARLGGDEFVIAAAGVTAEQAESLPQDGRCRSPSTSHRASSPTRGSLSACRASWRLWG